MQPYEAILPLQLKELKLSAIYTDWEQSAISGEQQGWTYSQYLSHLCQVEIQKRQTSRITRRIKESFA